MKNFLLLQSKYIYRQGMKYGFSTIKKERKNPFILEFWKNKSIFLTRLATESDNLVSLVTHL